MMDAKQTQNSLIFQALLSLLLLWLITKWLLKPSQKKKSPPSPPKLPILGNLHQLGSLPHKNLQKMANKHGPLMLLHLGTVPVLVVSSADAARQILITHDITFADRPQYKKLGKIVYDGKDVIFGLYGEHWRQLKSFFVLQLLNSKRVHSFQSIKEEETASFVRKIAESSGPVDLTMMFSEFTNTVICRSAFGWNYSKSERRREFVRLVKVSSEVFGSVDIGEFIPWLSWVDRLTGFDAKVRKVRKGFDDFFESVIEEHIQTHREEENRGKSFIDIMLQYYNTTTTDFSLDGDGIKGILLDIFAAGSDTTSISLEWVMAELLQRPAVMEKLQREVRDITNQRENITNDDLQKMQYLKAVIKETFRHHPPAPLLLPRVARADVDIKSYGISKGTMVLINAYAIGRDPASWDEPEKFDPERFMDSSIDFKGLDCELIPFGAGRRGCPGIAFATSMIELLIANVVQKFKWELPQGEELDMKESPGITMCRASPLFAIPTTIHY